MELYLVQHGKAASKEVHPERPLTEEGRRDVEKAAAFIKPMAIAVDYFWHSTKTRAIQTMEILSEAVTVRKERTARNGLAPNDGVAPVKDEIVSAGRDVMIVGHLPFLSKLASLLLTGAESANVVAFKQGGIVCLSCPEGNHWQIEWMVVPELLA